MLRGFFVGAAVGFLFGSSTQGLQSRQRLNDLFSGLLSELKDEEEKPVQQEAVRGRFGKENRRNGGNGRSGKADGNANADEGRSGKADSLSGSKAQSSEGGKPGDGGVSLDKAVELAEALNAKPTPPPTDELEPGEHAVGA